MKREKESRRLKTGFVLEKKIRNMVCMAGTVATLAVFCVCQATAWATPSSGTSVSSNIVVRDAAVSGAQIGSLSDGQEVTITGETTGSDGKKWYAVTFEIDGSERDGWVRADLIDTTGTTVDEDDEEETTASDTDTQDTTQTDTEEQDTAQNGAESLRFELTDGYVDLIDVPADVAVTVSDRFTEATITSSDGGSVTCYQLATADELVSNDADLTNFYYVYGTNDIGESGWYVYDFSQNSLQKSTLNMTYSLTAQAEDEAAAETAQIELAGTTRMVIAALALVCVLLLILTIVFSIRYRRLRAELEREERLEERRTKSQRNGSGGAKKEKKNDTTEQEKKTGKKHSKAAENVEEPEEAKENEPVEIMDLDDMDDADYETMLGQYLDEHLDEEEKHKDSTDDGDDDLKFL